MASEGFQFKQFYVRHDKCAMKVGTDGVLLGCEAPLPDYPSHVLDVGTGSGLVALMMAQQKSQAQIDAIDIDPFAVEQAKENFAASPWSDRLHAYHSSLQEWQKVNDKCSNGNYYDLIVSNPPYFRNSLKNPDKARQLARHTDTLSYEDLLIHSTRLLKPEGVLTLILPASAEEEMVGVATRLALSAKYSPKEKSFLYCVSMLRISIKEGQPPKRVIMYFRKLEARKMPYICFYSSCFIEDKNGGRSFFYQELTKDFYL